tara:strand:+ start:483 stop:1334 length:852 start_codon:yes stop_codon:yes gene_type:complete
VIVVVIPVFNEEKNIGNVIKNVLPNCDKIIVVNDASTDNSIEVIEKFSNENVLIISNNKNLGIGGATKVGIKKAIEIGAKYIVKFDGDGQHSADDIPKFINKLEHNNFDYVKGNRFKTSVSEMPIVKLLGNLISTNLQKIITGNYRLSDPNNGFIAFNSYIFEKIDYKYLREDYFFENSFLLNLIIYKYKIDEVPIKTIYADEKSSIPLVLGSIKLIPVFLKLFFLKNYLNLRVNLSMGSLIFLSINIAIIINIINNDLVSLNQIVILLSIYLLIDVINFLNE